MKNNSNKKENNDFINKFMDFLKQNPNINKKGELEDMLKEDDFHNKNMTEEDYQAEQEAWLKKVKKNKKTD